MKRHIYRLGNGIIYKADMLEMGISVAGRAHQLASSAPAGWGMSGTAQTLGEPWSLSQLPGQFGTSVLHRVIESWLVWDFHLRCSMDLAVQWAQ